MKPLISLHDYGRPWKLFTLACGIVLLIAGSYWQPAPDWDVPISLIMGVGTYFCAPVSTRIVARRRWKLLPLALFLLWLCVDGVYWVYWSWRNPEALAQMREANAFASTFLYLLCGMIWLHDGPLRELLVRR
ncbi:Uncharacterised protein [Kingella denitrificans]|uniref:Uncharacterized protein n=1 Tax=Kingella denitrificans ATCC 33394 TaxID=888741 RepID=F0EY53_9NEIS|nr:hypothetical protein [Kingella denitrificans]EGC17783.1 hypothetical protein HMPREF9098_0761 [Kingella denitrificans ATCC 33394]QQB41445.1 hypothetical protein I6I17_08050 [Kingella denitrificans]STR12718.1 Uncharacterised protein [Kingella denitrificans]